MLEATLDIPAAVFLFPLPRREVAEFPMPNAVLVLLSPVGVTPTPARPRISAASPMSLPVEDAVLLMPIAVFLLPSPAINELAALPIPSAPEKLLVPTSELALLFRPIANAELPSPFAYAVLPGKSEMAQAPCPVAEQLPSPIDPRPPTDIHAALAVPEENPQKAEAHAPVARAPTTTLPACELPDVRCARCLPAELTRSLCFRFLDPRCFDAT
jgi:hypothetical protein